MSTKRIYRRMRVNQVTLYQVRALGEKHSQEVAEVGLDIAKQEIVVVVRWESGEFERPWSVRNPSEIGLLVERLAILKETCAELKVGMESTGTYGEAVRHALTNACLPVYRVSGKSVSDYKEIFDGVPSQHDGKDAAIIAELTGIDKGTPWPYQAPDETESEMRHQVTRMDAFQDQVKPWYGRLEGVLTKHWPELLEPLTVRNATLISLLNHYGGSKKNITNVGAMQGNASGRRSLKKRRALQECDHAIRRMATSRPFRVEPPPISRSLHAVGLIAPQVSFS